VANRRLIQCVIYAVLGITSANGCQALHRYRPVAILVRDGETKQPIPGTMVRISYPFTPAYRAPWNASETTANDGIVRLWAAPAGDVGLMVEVEARGYLFEEKDVAVEAIQAIEPARWFEAVEQRPPSFVFDMYAEPRPKIELVVPTGYRGTLKVDVETKETVAFEPGQRLFSYVVPASADMQITGPPLLQHILPPDFCARYADGTKLRHEAKEREIGFWWLRQEGRYHCFLVGTRRDFDDLSPSDTGGPGAGASHGGGNGRGGRGRRGHRDAQSAAD
jgi:hypothetical protein